MGKYQERFQSAVQGGPLKDQAVGVLLGFPKMERQLFPGIMVDLIRGVDIPVPHGVFNDSNPGLVALWGFTLVRSEVGDHLVPVLLLPWTHPEFDAIARLTSIQPDWLRVEIKPYPFPLHVNQLPAESEER